MSRCAQFLGAVDAVLPLTARDVPRAEILFASLRRRFDGLGTVFVVVPRAQLDEIGRAFRPRSDGVGLGLEILPEDEVVPEFALFPRMHGWYKQQLIKLAIAERVSSAFYLTLDADVVLTRDVSPERLCPNGKASCFIIEEDLHPRWYARTARLIDRPLRQKGIVHNVTPAVLAKDGVRLLTEHFEARWQQRRWARGARAWRQRWVRLRLGRRRTDLAGWRLFLAAGMRWTEYALYYSFLEAYDLFDRFHERVTTCVYDIDRSVWKAGAQAFDNWSPKALFEGEGPPYFVVLQSNTQLPPPVIWEKLDGYL
ncbi:MAG: hypothetical protein H6729_05885 [Deltaproteobacteria bacterium]|nr:hypothetical protein [Deltaproteobacteria bacterium]